MHRFGVLTDVNANLEALTAVLNDADAHGVSDLIFLGDGVGYGPDPVQCVSLLRERCRIYLRGRLESHMLEGRESELSIRERDMLVVARESLHSFSDHWEWLSDRASVYNAHGIMAVHTNPRGFEKECLVLDNIRQNASLLSGIFSTFTRLLFIGDNHQPWLITGENRAYTEKDIDYEYNLSAAGKAIVSAGSVGQPRDGDPRASYLIVSDHSVLWRRVEYDLDRTIAKIQATPWLKKEFADRLREGI